MGQTFEENTQEDTQFRMGLYAAVYSHVIGIFQQILLLHPDRFFFHLVLIHPTLET